MNCKEQGNGVGQPARAREKAWDAMRLPGKTKRRGERGGDEKLSSSPAKVNPGSWRRLLLRVHSTNTGQLAAPAARGMGPPAAGGEVRSGPRRAGPFPRRGARRGPNLWGSEDETPNA